MRKPRPGGSTLALATGAVRSRVSVVEYTPSIGKSDLGGKTTIRYQRCHLGRTEQTEEDANATVESDAHNLHIDGPKNVYV